MVRANLQRSGLFKTSDAPMALDERSRIALPEWRGRGADALVAGSVSRLADGRWDVRYKLWDTVKGEELLGQSKLVVDADLRLAAHRISDEVHQALTGERGVYATRIHVTHARFGHLSRGFGGLCGLCPRGASHCRAWLFCGDCFHAT